MFSLEFWNAAKAYFVKIIGPATLITMKMHLITMFLATIFGFLLAILLIVFGPTGLRSSTKIYGVLDFFVNVIRSFPIMILIVAISPLTRFVIGTSIGPNAAIFPLTIAATAFSARMMENSLLAVDPQLIEAARSFGASNLQIILKVMVVEAIPSMLSGTILTAIFFLSATTLAGAVGGGGLGSVALNYGYQGFNDIILYTAVFILFVMVQIIQRVGWWFYRKIS